MLGWEAILIRILLIHLTGLAESPAVPAMTLPIWFSLCIVGLICSSLILSTVLLPLSFLTQALPVVSALPP